MSFDKCKRGAWNIPDNSVMSKKTSTDAPKKSYGKTIFNRKIHFYQVFFAVLRGQTLTHYTKNEGFPLKISSLNVTKSAGNCSLGTFT